MGLRMGQGTREVRDNVVCRDIISHLFGAGPVCLLSGDHTLSCSPSAVVLPSGAVCGISGERTR